MGDTDETVVKTVKLTKIFRDFWLREKVTAVADLDLEILPREVFGLLGPNGSGKSTTLKMILGLLFPTRGRVVVFGRRPTNVSVKSRIGFLPEESYLYQFLDAYETLDFYGRLFHQPRRERRRRIGMLLDMVGLSAVAYRRVGEYSKGMQRRIGLAQALINDPDLLILDEPTAGMDPIGTRQFKDLIRMLPDRGKTVILSSHLLADVEDVCDRICILYGGRDRARGTIDELLSREGRTQITTDLLDQQTLAEVERVLSEAGRGVLGVTAPRDKLESLFLQIVAEAQQQHLATGGALAGGQVAEFLRREPHDDGQEVIEALVSASAVDEPPEDEPQTPETEGGREDVIEDLVHPEKPVEQSASEVQSGPPVEEQRQPDSSVIDELIEGDEDQQEK
jgi:ABC-2 type transport system ATP-binding protein